MLSEAMDFPLWVMDIAARSFIKPSLSTSTINGNWFPEIQIPKETQEERMKEIKVEKPKVEKPKEEIPKKQLRVVSKEKTTSEQPKRQLKIVQKKKEEPIMKMP